VVREVTRTVTSTTTTLASGAPVTTTITVTPTTTVTKTETITTTTPTTPTTKEIRIGLGSPGGFAYIVGSLLADTIRDVFPTFGVSSYPIGGVTANTKEFVKGNLEVTFSSASDLKLLYAREEWYKDIPQNVLMPVHTLYILTNQHIIVTTPEFKEKYRLNSWKDLDGKKVTLYSVKYENYKWYEKALKMLGVNFTHVEMDLDMIPDALKKGDIVACVTPITGGTPPPWVLSLFTKVKTIAIYPSEDEVKVLEKAGLAMSWFSTKKYKEYGVDVLGADKTFGVTLVLGWNTHPKFMSEDEVYKLLKEMISKKDELAKMTTYFSEFAEDPIKLQTIAISISPEVPAHPGLAKLLKEYGVWKNEWKVAS
jgi:TRAP-type uncharacterized transport system substrate-binding protein